MRRLFRPAAAVLAVVGTALWFFGGPNAGRSEWYRDVPAGPAGATASERQFVFRPGVDFLAVALAGAAALALAGKDRRGQSDR